jgi:hypothetical protein
MNPKRLTLRSGAPGLTNVPLAQHIEDLYLRRFKRTVPDPVVPVRQLLREALARERAEAHERRRMKRQAEIDHADAARFSLLTLRRLLPGGPEVDDDWASPSQEEAKSLSLNNEMQAKKGRHENGPASYCTATGPST